MGSLLVLLLLAGTGTAIAARFAGDVAEGLSRLLGNGKNHEKEEKKENEKARKFTCPNPKCSKVMVLTAEEIIEKKYSCPYCNSKGRM
jgi:hypothetical protein